jgi:hypothetical protein
LVDPKKNQRGPPFQEDNGRSVVAVSTVPHLRMREPVETPPSELGSIYRKDVTPPMAALRRLANSPVWWYTVSIA